MRTARCTFCRPSAEVSARSTNAQPQPTAKETEPEQYLLRLWKFMRLDDGHVSLETESGQSKSRVLRIVSHLFKVEAAHAGE